MKLEALNNFPGNTPIDRDELEGLIPNLSLKRELDEYERLNFLEGHKWAMSARVMKTRDPLSEAYVRILHQKMFDQTWKWAGIYRWSEKNIGCLVHEIRDRIPALIENARYWVEHHTFPVDEIAVRTHHETVGRIHAFPNGNGRHARLWADVIAVKHGSTAFTWGLNSIAAIGPTRDAYFKSLKIADDGDIRDLLAFARS